MPSHNLDARSQRRKKIIIIRHLKWKQQVTSSSHHFYSCWDINWRRQREKQKPAGQAAAPLVHLFHLSTPTLVLRSWWGSSARPQAEVQPSTGKLSAQWVDTLSTSCPDLCRRMEYRFGSTLNSTVMPAEQPEQKMWSCTEWKKEKKNVYIYSTAMK